MTDEQVGVAPEKQVSSGRLVEGGPPTGRRRVRRRRSSKRSRRVQSQLPFTSLRFSRPRLPTPGKALMLALALFTVGLSAGAIRAADGASVTLTQARAQLAAATRGAAAGRLAADQIAAQAQADAAQRMAAQDMARKQGSRAPLGFSNGLAQSGGYARGPLEDQQGAIAPAPSGPTLYGSALYNATPYGTGPASEAASSSSGSVMGYTLPQAPRPQ